MKLGTPLEVSLHPFVMVCLVLLLGIIGTLLLWSWSAQRALSEAMVLVVLLATLLYWGKVLNVLLRVLRARLMLRLAGETVYRVSLSMIIAMFALFFIPYMFLTFLFVLFFRLTIGEMNFIVLFLLTLSILHCFDALAESMFRHATKNQESQQNSTC